MLLTCLSINSVVCLTEVTGSWMISWVKTPECAAEDKWIDGTISCTEV